MSISFFTISKHFLQVKISLTENHRIQITV